MKTLLILGAGKEQVAAIAAAKAKGVRTLVLDMNAKADGASLADEFHAVSTRVSPGQRSLAAALLQQELAAMHFAVPRTGSFDDGTQRAVIAYRKLSNLSRMAVALYPGMRICSFTFEQVSTPVSVSYRDKPNNKYAGQTSPLASKLVSEVSGRG